MALRPRRWVRMVACLRAVVLLIGPGGARGRERDPTADPGGKAGIVPVAEPAASPTQRPGIDRRVLMRLLWQANPMLWLLVACSVVTLGYVLERGLALRRDRVIPREFVDRFLERLSGGKLDRERALELCRADDSPAARVFAFVVGAWG